MPELVQNSSSPPIAAPPPIPPGILSIPPEFPPAVIPSILDPLAKRGVNPCPS